MVNQNIAQQAVLQSARALIHTFSSGANSAQVEETISNGNNDFLARVKQLDEAVEAGKLTEVEDMLFDLLMVHYLAAETHKDTYFDSDEWIAIENKTLDRGSEMLNLFLYISEANENEVEMSMDDFLNEFLLIGEDEFQDEYRIYESLIANEDIVEANIDELRRAQQTVKEDTGLREYLVPIVLFFQLVEGVISESEIPASLSKFEEAALNALVTFNKASIIS